MNSILAKRQNSRHYARRVPVGIFSTSTIGTLDLCANDYAPRSGQVLDFNSKYFSKSTSRSAKTVIITTKNSSNVNLFNSSNLTEKMPIDDSIFIYQKENNFQNQKEKIKMVNFNEKNYSLASIRSPSKYYDRVAECKKKTTMGLADYLPNIQQVISKRGKNDGGYKNDSFQATKSKYNV